MMRKRDTDRADISFEIFHHYLGPETDEEKLLLEIRAAVFWAKPLLDAWRAQGLIVSTCVLIDNISNAPIDEIPYDSHDIRDLIYKAFSSHNVIIDYFCDEGDLNRYAHWIHKKMIISPKEADGAFGRQDIEYERLSEFERYFVIDRSDWGMAENRKLKAESPERSAFGFDVRRSIGVSAPIWRSNRKNEKVFSCPMLACSWQAVRIGILLENEIREDISKEESFVSLGFKGFPPEIVSTAENPESPFCGASTVTLLGPRYIGVEHAVQRMLKMVEFPETFKKRLAASNRALGVNKSYTDGFMVDHRMNYIFGTDRAATLFDLK